MKNEKWRFWGVIAGVLIAGFIYMKIAYALIEKVILKRIMSIWRTKSQ